MDVSTGLALVAILVVGFLIWMTLPRKRAVKPPAPSQKPADVVTLDPYSGIPAQPTNKPNPTVSWEAPVESGPTLSASTFDHDGDGKAGGSLPASKRGLDKLRADYERVKGKKPDMRWGEAVLRKRIALAKKK